jgi:class III poly(R)-hydroxyalkanoic acid synthase PhaE subunit
MPSPGAAVLLKRLFSTEGEAPMPDSSKNPFFPEEMISAWMKASGSFFEAMAGVAKPPFSPGDGDATGFDRFSETWTSVFKTWASTHSAMGDSEAVESLIRSMTSAPELSLRLLQTGMNGFSLLQQRWAERLTRLNDSSGPYDFGDLDKDFLNRWTEAYQKEFRQFLKVPQLGLTRFYQERFNEALDRYNLLQASLTEFVHLFSVPVEKSLQVMNKKLAQMADDGKLPDDARQIYKEWIKVLEGHYMTLFQSSEYADTMAKTIDSLNEFISARQKVMESLLKSVPVPTQQEMDELYKELYNLKKRLWKMEKEKKQETGK